MGEDREVISIASKKKRDCIILKKTHWTNKNMINKKLFHDAHFSGDSFYSDWTYFPQKHRNIFTKLLNINLIAVYGKKLQIHRTIASKSGLNFMSEVILPSGT